MAMKAQHSDWNDLLLSENKTREGSSSLSSLVLLWVLSLSPTVAVRVWRGALCYLTECSLNMLPQRSWETVIVSLSEKSKPVRLLSLELSAVLTPWTDGAKTRKITNRPISMFVSVLWFLFIISPNDYTQIFSEESLLSLHSKVTVYQ